jgi:5-formyltetrahydrofolate cyclo-ligase
MDMGIGFSETLLILLLLLVFFGSKNMPKILRDLGRYVALIKAKTNEFMAEVQRATGPENKTGPDEVTLKKRSLRASCRARREAQSKEEVREKSNRIIIRFKESSLWSGSRSLMVYCSLPAEVRTDELIEQALSEKKRVIVPYIDSTHRMKIAEITGLDEVAPTPLYSIREPDPQKQKPFFKSDLDLIICPGIAFDRNGRRLGFGKAFYDSFLKELQGKIPIVAFSFDFQIQDEVPFDYHDVAMDMIFTETETITLAAG